MGRRRNRSMASEYIKYLNRDSTPSPQSSELTPKEKWKNWWYYHWKMVVLVVLAVISVISMVLKNLGITEPLTDYQVAYIGSKPLSDEAVAAVNAAFQEYGEDCSGDGVITVVVNQYVIYQDVETAEAAQMNSAAISMLESDIVSRQSYFFLLENPEEFCALYQALADADGNLPPEGDDSWEDKVYPVSEIIDGIPTEDDGLYFSRRGFYQEQTMKYRECCDKLWDTLISSK